MSRDKSAVASSAGTSEKQTEVKTVKCGSIDACYRESLNERRVVKNFISRNNQMAPAVLAVELLFNQLL